MWTVHHVYTKAEPCSSGLPSCVNPVCIKRGASGHGVGGATLHCFWGVGTAVGTSMVGGLSDSPLKLAAGLKGVEGSCCYVTGGTWREVTIVRFCAAVAFNKLRF